MNDQAVKTADATPILLKTDPTAPALIVTGPNSISIKGGTTFAGRTFTEDTPVIFDVALEAGADYAVTVKDGAVGYARLCAPPSGTDILGGFHYAPGGNAPARAGGDSVPAINPYSVWDQNFRPKCACPCGMAFVAARNCWVDIYLTAKDHLANGTSQFGVTIADGDDPPENPDGGRFKKFDYATACAVMTHHGKTLLSVDDFFASAIGVTEKTSCDDDPDITGLYAPRTSKFGLMQPTGTMWQWGDDGDPDMPRASIFGGSWLHGEIAGSRYANVAYSWPDSSNDYIGARGRSDHLQLG